MGGLTAVLDWVHSPDGRITSKNARLAAVRIGVEMGRATEASLDLLTLAKETRMGRATTMNAITEACGPAGIFDRKKPSVGRTNVYSLKTASPLAVNTAKIQGVKGRPHCQPAVRNKEKPITTPTTAHTREGRFLDQIACPSCERVGFLTQSPGRKGNPPGFWCRNSGGCGFNFPIDYAAIIDQMTPGARKAIESMAPKVDAPADPVADGFKRILERGMVLQRGSEHEA